MPVCLSACLPACAGSAQVGSPRHAPDVCVVVQALQGCHHAAQGAPGDAWVQRPRNEQKVCLLQQLHVHPGEAVEEGAGQALAPAALLQAGEEETAGNALIEEFWAGQLLSHTCAADRQQHLGRQASGRRWRACSGFCAPNTRKVLGQRKVWFSSGMNTCKKQRGGRRKRGRLGQHARQQHL